MHKRLRATASSKHQKRCISNAYHSALSPKPYPLYPSAILFSHQRPYLMRGFLLHRHRFPMNRVPHMHSVRQQTLLFAQVSTHRHATTSPSHILLRGNTLLSTLIFRALYRVMLNISLRSTIVSAQGLHVQHLFDRVEDFCCHQYTSAIGLEDRCTLYLSLSLPNHSDDSANCPNYFLHTYISVRCAVPWRLAFVYHHRGLHHMQQSLHSDRIQVLYIIWYSTYS